MENVDPQLERRRGGLFLLDGDIARLPEVRPRQRVGGQEVVKAAGLAQGLRGVEARLRNGGSREVERATIFSTVMEAPGCIGQASSWAMTSVRQSSCRSALSRWAW